MMGMHVAFHSQVLILSFELKSAHTMFYNAKYVVKSLSQKHDALLKSL